MPGKSNELRLVEAPTGISLQREEKSPKGGGIATGYLVSGHGTGEDDAGRVMSGAERGA